MSIPEDAARAVTELLCTGFVHVTTPMPAWWATGVVRSRAKRGATAAAAAGAAPRERRGFRTRVAVDADRAVIPVAIVSSDNLNATLADVARWLAAVRDIEVVGRRAIAYTLPHLAMWILPSDGNDVPHVREGKAVAPPLRPALQLVPADNRISVHRKLQSFNIAALRPADVISLPGEKSRDPGCSMVKVTDTDAVLVDRTAATKRVMDAHADVGALWDETAAVTEFPNVYALPDGKGALVVNHRTAESPEHYKAVAERYGQIYFTF